MKNEKRDSQQGSRKLAVTAECGARDDWPQLDEGLNGKAIASVPVNYEGRNRKQETGLWLEVR